MNTTQLTKSDTDRMVSGVCGGLADYLHVDPAMVRLAWVMLTIASFGLGTIAYILLTLVLPEPANAGQPVSSVMEQNLSQMGSNVNRAGQTISTAANSVFAGHQNAGTTMTVADPDAQNAAGQNVTGKQASTGNTAAFVLIALGAFFLMANLGLISFKTMIIFWPLVLVVLGIMLLNRRKP